MLVDMLAERKKLFVAHRAAKQRSKTPNKNQIRNRMCTYLKNMGGYKHNQLKGRKSLKEIISSLDKHTNNEHVETKKDDQEEAEMKRNIEIVKDDEVAIDVAITTQAHDKAGKGDNEVIECILTGDGEDI
ncbi:hypothetical protein Tco_1343529 [Tanacetum coccineum]